MAEKKKILYMVEAMGGGVFTYIVDLANELVDTYDMYIAYAVRKQTPANYKDYFDKRIHLIEVKNFGRAINPVKDLQHYRQPLPQPKTTDRHHEPDPDGVEKTAGYRTSLKITSGEFSADEQQGRAEAKQRNITDKKLSRQSAHQKQLQSLQK